MRTYAERKRVAVVRLNRIKAQYAYAGERGRFSDWLATPAQRPAIIRHVQQRIRAQDIACAAGPGDILFVDSVQRIANPLGTQTSSLCSQARGFLGKLETDFAVLQFQISGERTAAFGNEAVEKIGFSVREKFLRLFFGNIAAEDRFA